MSQDRVTTRIALLRIKNGEKPLPHIPIGTVKLPDAGWAGIYHLAPISLDSGSLSSKRMDEKSIAYVARAAYCFAVDATLREKFDGDSTGYSGQEVVTSEFLQGTLIPRVDQLAWGIRQFTPEDVSPNEEGTFLDKVLGSLVEYDEGFGKLTDEEVKQKILHATAPSIHINANTITTFFPPLMQAVHSIYQQTHDGIDPRLYEFQEGVMRAMHIVMAGTKMTSSELGDYHMMLERSFGGDVQSGRRGVYDISNFVPLGENSIMIPKEVRDQIMEMVRDLSSYRIQGEERRKFILGCPAAENVPLDGAGREDFFIANLMRLALFIPHPRGHHASGKMDSEQK